MTSDIELGESVTHEILALNGIDKRQFVKTTVLDTGLVLISWYKKTSPPALEALVYQTSTGQSTFGDANNCSNSNFNAVTKPAETLYEFALYYALGSYHIKPISGLYTYAVAFQSTMVRERSIQPDTNGLIIVHKNGTVLMENQYYDNEWVCLLNSHCDIFDTQHDI